MNDAGAPQKGSFLRSVAGTYGTQLLLLPLTLGAAVLQARLVGPDGRGQISMITATSNVAVLYLGFGLSASITFHIASDRLEPRALAKALPLLLGALTVLLWLLLHALIASGLEEYVLGSIPTAFSVPALVALFCFALCNSWLSAILNARRDFGFTNMVGIGVVLFPLASYGLALVFGAPLPPSTFAIGVLVAAEIVRSAALSARVVRGELARSQYGRVLAIPFRAMISYSLLAYACDAVQFLTYRFDVWLVRNYRGDTELGRYSLAVTLGELVWLLAGSFASVLFPHVPTLDRALAIRLCVRVAALALVATVGLSLVGFLLAIPMVPLLFSSRFAPSVPLLGILLLGMAPYSVAKILGNFIAGVGAMRLSLVSAVIGMVVCLSLDFALIPRYGAVGAAVASAVAYVVFTLSLLILFQRFVEVPFRTLWRYARSPLPRA